MTLIFDDTITGHHLEYLSHYRTMAIHDSEEQYVFLVSKAFQLVKGNVCWEDAENITVAYISEEEQRQCQCGNVLRAAWNKSRIVAQAVKQYKADRVLLTMLSEFIPFLLFLLPRRCRVSGIIYRIYLRDEAMHGVRLLAEQLRYWMMSCCKGMHRVYILNDTISAERLNKIYGTDKFRSIPDPIPNVDTSKLKSLRGELNIPDDETVYLHFGGLCKRKGTIEIIKALALGTEEQLRGKTFIFAGKVYDEINEEFYLLLSIAQKKTHVKVYDEFCTYALLYNLCYTCDIILAPYQITSLSSGVLGYGALFRKPVLGPAGGLIGELIRNYHLGKCMDDVRAQDILKILDKPVSCESDNYVTKNTVEMFVQVLSEK